MLLSVSTVAAPHAACRSCMLLLQSLRMCSSARQQLPVHPLSLPAHPAEHASQLQLRLHQPSSSARMPSARVQHTPQASSMPHGVHAGGSASIQRRGCRPG